MREDLSMSNALEDSGKTTSLVDSVRWLYCSNVSAAGCLELSVPWD